MTDTLTQQLLHQHPLVQTQSARLGGLLMALTAVQARGYRLPLAGPLRALVIVQPACLALSLLGASTGWLTISAIWLAATGRPAAPAWPVLCTAALVAAAVTLGVRAPHHMAPARVTGNAAVGRPTSGHTST